MSARTVWGGVLDSCPGLLCCVINMKGQLLHATNGYKAVALRLFGHKCEEGCNYPPLSTANDKLIHEALTAACINGTNAIEFTENGKLWELTASPLRIEGQGLAGVVIRIASEAAVKPVQNVQTIQQVIQSNPDILNTVPFRAAVTDKKGTILAVNKFLASCVRAELVGRNIIELVSPETDSQLTHILMTRSGFVECTMPDILAAGNFYDDITPYLDEELNEVSRDSEIEAARNVRLHATPVDWNGREAVMLTFEDITDSLKAHEQLRRLLTVDRTTGVLNRLGLEHAIARQFHESVNDGGHLSLVMIRVDNYRIIHEAKGFTSAQRIIRDFVRTSQKFLAEKAKAVFGRWSEDEFAILTKSSGAAAVVLANELRGRVKDVVISAGIADAADGQFMSASEFTGAAYDALTEAVNSGGNATVLAHS